MKKSLKPPNLQLCHLILVTASFWFYCKAIGITKISADDTRLVIFACLISIFYYSPAYSKFLQYFPNKFHRKAFANIFALSSLWVIVRRYLSHYSSNYEIPRIPSDQGYYLQMYEGFVKSTFSATEYLYGVGYPGAALLINKLVNDTDPFFALNLLLYVGISIGGFIILRSSLKSTVLAAAGAAAIFGNFYMIDFTARPWTSSVTAFAMTLTAAMIMTQNPLINEWRFGKLVSLSFLTAWTFASRYVDVIIFAPIWALILFSEYKHRYKDKEASNVGTDKTSMKMTLNQSKVENTFSHIKKIFFRPSFPFIIAITLMALGAFAVLFSHYYYFGSFLVTPYKFHYRPEGLNDQSLSTYIVRIGLPQFTNIYGNFIDHLSSSWDSEGLKKLGLKPIFSYFMPLHLIFLWRKKSFWHDKILLAFALSAACFLFIYGTHPGTTPGCLQFGSAHYFKWIYIFASIGAIIVLYQMMSLKIHPLQTAKYVTIISVLFCTVEFILGILVPKDFLVKRPKNLTFQKGESLTIEYQLVNKFGDKIPSFAAKQYEVYLNLSQASQNGSVRLSGKTIDGDYSKGLVVVDRQYTASSYSLIISGWTTIPKTLTSNISQ